MGYRRTGKTEVVNDRLTLVFYEKRQTPERLQQYFDEGWDNGKRTV